MALTITEAPVKYLNTNPTTVTNVGSDAFGKVVFDVAAHGLSTGNVIYIKSKVEDYNGYVQAVVLNAAQFNIARIYESTSNTIDYTNTTSATIYYTSAKTWHCVHHPITYRISSDLHPANSVDTVRTISSVTDSNGYCALSLSGDIKATGSAAKLEYIKITSSTDDDLNAVWQIVEYTNDTTFSIAVPYSSANDTALTGASIQYYYNNYHAKVYVYSGIPSGHVLEDKRPQVVAATLKLIPDEDNRIFFSISNILAADLKVKNNLLLSTLPNNIDFWTGFLITISECYDVSNGTTLSVSESSPASGGGSGYAVNAKLPFKNVYAGALSEYVSQDSNQMFLTLFDTPAIFSGKYFDLTFVSNYYQTFINPALSTGSNQQTGTNWSGGSAPSVSLSGGGTSKAYALALTNPMQVGYTYRIGYRITTSVGGTFTLVVSGSADQTGVSADFASDSTLSGVAGTFTGALNLTITSTNKYFLNFFIEDTDASACVYTIVDYWIYPVNDPLFNDHLLRQKYYLSGVLQTTTDIEVNGAGEGVYRQQLTDPDCDYDSLTATVYKYRIVPLTPPGGWTNSSGSWDTKNFTQFIEAVTAATSSVRAYDSVAGVSGEVIDLSGIVITVSGGWTGTITFFAQAYDNAMAATSTSPATIVTANGTYGFAADATLTGTTTRLEIGLNENVSAGTANVTITIPETLNILTETAITETKSISIDCKCVKSKAEGYYLSWLNYLGGFDYWYFTAYADNIIDITDSGETEENTFPEWPNSYGEFADTVRKQTYRNSREQVLIRSQHVTEAQLQALKYIKTSPLVQIVNSVYDRRTVLVDTDSFTYLKEGNNLFEISFTITYTDDVPSQRV